MRDWGVFPLSSDLEPFGTLVFIFGRLTCQIILPLSLGAWISLPAVGMCMWGLFPAKHPVKCWHLEGKVLRDHREVRR